jgi:hypothetical protein
VVGIFPNEAAIFHLVGAILLEQNDEWGVQRNRYITAASAPAVSYDFRISLPSIAVIDPALPKTMAIAMPLSRPWHDLATLCQ